MKKALVALFVIACVVYGIAGKSAASQSATKLQNSLDRMTAAEAALK